MAIHTPGKSDSGSMGSTVAKQNPIKDGILKMPKTGANKLAKVTRNMGARSSTTKQ